MKSVLYLMTAVLLGPFISSAYAQSAPRGATYIEVGGNGSLFCCSLNLDYLATPHWSVRVGIGTELFADVRNGTALIMMNRLIGGRGHFVEMGAGVVRQSVGSGSHASSYQGATLTLGYRRQKTGRKGSFRVAFAPEIGHMAEWSKERTLFSKLGISNGWTF